MTPPDSPTGACRHAPPGGGLLSTHLNPATIAERVLELPALPAALTEAQAALRQDEVNLDHLAGLIERDQALCARTLRLGNSAFYGLSGQVGTVRDALQLLGLRTVAQLLGGAALAGYANVGRCDAFDFPVFWRHAMAVAMAARDIARQRGADAEQAGVAGLLHDAGQLALAAYFPAALSGALVLGRSADRDAVDAERAVMGIDHADVGALVARHWRLPEPIVHAIGRHHDPEPDSGTAPVPTTVQELTDTLHLADACAHALNLAGAHGEAVPAMSLDCWERLQAGSLDLTGLFGRVEAGMQQLDGVLPE